MVDRAFLLLLAAAICSLGVARPTENLPPDGSTDADVTPSNGQSISDLIVEANKDADMILSQGDIQVLPGRSANTCKGCLWDKNKQGIVTVPYAISSDYTVENINLIQNAMIEITAMSCMGFKQRTNEASYVSIKDGKGCYSTIGRTKKEQTLSLSRSDCMYYGVIQHEILHALGLFHEHTREDRDDYVQINWEFVKEENRGDFEIDSGDTMNIPYDYNSIMHYGSTTFTNTEGQKTIIPIPDPNVFIGQQFGLSQLDVKRLNTLYNCNLCRTKLLGQSGSFSSSDSAAVDINDNCLWLLQVYVSQIVLQFNQFSCLYAKCTARINVYDGVNKNSTLLATIFPGQPVPLLVSSGKFMLIEYITDRSNPSKFNGSYSSARYGGTFTTDNGFLDSPKYPNYYPSNAVALYVILAPPTKKVLLNIGALDMELSLKCSNDFLLIRDGSTLLAPILGTFCGKTGNVSVKSTGPAMVVVFSSNAIFSGKGFRIGYSFVS